MVLMLLGIHWGLPNVESWNGDDISPDKPLRVVADWLHGHHKYPYLHWWLNLGLYAPWLAGATLLGEVDVSCWPRLRPGCFEHAELHMTVFMVSTRLLSVAMALGIVAGTHRLARVLLRDERAAVAAAATAAFSTPLVFFAHTGNLDVPHVFWFTLSLGAAVAIARRGARVDYAAFGLLAGCALATKDSIVGAYVGLGLALLCFHVAREGRGRRGGVRAAAATLVDRKLVLLVALVVLVYGASQNLVGNFPGWLRHFELWLAEDGPVGGMRARETPALRLLANSIGALGASIGWPLLLLGAAGVAVAAVRHRLALLLLAPVASYFAISLVGGGFVAPRTVFPLVPILAVFVGAGVSALLAAPSRAARLAVGAVLVAVFAHAFLVAFASDLRLLRDSRYQAEAFFREQVPVDAHVTLVGPTDFHPRLARMGYELESIPAAELDAEGLSAREPGWLVLTSLHQPRKHRALLDELRGGGRGYELVWEGEGGTPLDRWLRPAAKVGAVSPRLWILRQEGVSTR